MGVSIDEFEKAMNALEEAIAFAAIAHDPVQFKIARDATIQRFEFCVELAWKTSLKKLGIVGSSPKNAIRDMLQNQLVQDSNLWFGFIEARNTSSQSYDEKVAAEVFDSAKAFSPHGRGVLALLKKL